MINKSENLCKSTCRNQERCIFHLLNQEDSNDPASHPIVNSYKKNQAIFLQGNIGHGLFCINAGKVKLIISTNDGKESIIRIAAPGDIIGHHALFTGEHYHASAVSLEDSRVCFYSKDFVLKMLTKYPGISLELLSRLSHANEIADSQNAILAHKNVRERLAGLLLSLQKSYGVKDLNSTRLEIKLTREEMAAMIGTTNETLVRLITEFKNEGIIAQDGKIIFIMNEEKLIEFANV